MPIYRVIGFTERGKKFEKIAFNDKERKRYVRNGEAAGLHVSVMRVKPTPDARALIRRLKR